MDPTRNNIQVSVKHCSLCQGDTEYYCHHCQQNMCLQCKKKHVIDLDTKDHDVTRYTKKRKTPPKQVMSEQSRNRDKHEPCDVPVSDSCPEQILYLRTRDSDHHEPRDISMSDPCPEQVMGVRSRDPDYHELCEVLVNDRYPGHVPRRYLPPVCLSPLERSRHNGIEWRLCSERISYLRRETLYNRHVLLEGLRYDVKTGHKKVTIRGQSKAKDRGQELKDLIDYVLAGDLQDRCVIQKTRMFKHMVRLRMNMRRYVQYSSRPVKYLRFIKHKHDPQKDEHKLIKRLVNIMKGMQLSTETGKRHAGNELLLTLMPAPVLRKSVTVNNLFDCEHISCVTTHRVWIRRYFDPSKVELILTDTKSFKQFILKDSTNFSGGSHTVNSTGELIYINKDKHIYKLSNDMKTTTTCIEELESPWIPRCVYCSPSTGNLLVGVYNLDTETGQVRRYNNTGEQTQTIPHFNTPHTLYKDPCYITENNNGDLVVSDKGCVIVTERGGRHRFSYTGPPSKLKSELIPYGICTDVMSHILVCDVITKTVQMISKDGEFLSYLLTWKSPGIHVKLWGLSYDVNTHLLWVGSEKTVSVYRYVNRRLTITDDTEVCDDVSVGRSSPSRSICGYSQEQFDLFLAKIKAKEAAEAAEKIATEAKAASTKATEAVEGTPEGTEERNVTESKAKEALEAAEKAAKEAAAAREAADAAEKAETVNAAEEAAKAAEKAVKAAEEAAREAKRRAETAKISVKSVLNYDSCGDYNDDDLNDDLYYDSFSNDDLNDDLYPMSTSDDDLNDESTSDDDLNDASTSVDALHDESTSDDDLNDESTSDDDLNDESTSDDDLNDASTSVDALHDESTSDDDQNDESTSVDDLNDVDLNDFS